jgi:hypothetical protein
MKIFIVQDDGTKNFSSLFKLSEDIVSLTSQDCPAFENEAHIKAIRNKIRKDFNVSTDMLVLVGCPVNIGIAMAAVIRKGGYKILKWDRQTKGYIPIKI